MPPARRPKRFGVDSNTHLPKVCFDSRGGITLETFISRVGASGCNTVEALVDSLDFAVRSGVTC